MTTVEQLMGQPSLLLMHSIKVPPKEEVGKEIFLFGQVETVADTRIIAIAMAIQILFIQVGFCVVKTQPNYKCIFSFHQFNIAK